MIEISWSISKMWKVPCHFFYLFFVRLCQVKSVIGGCMATCWGDMKEMVTPRSRLRGPCLCWKRRAEVTHIWQWNNSEVHECKRGVPKRELWSILSPMARFFRRVAEILTRRILDSHCMTFTLINFPWSGLPPCSVKSKCWGWGERSRLQAIDFCGVGRNGPIAAKKPGSSSYFITANGLFLCLNNLEAGRKH